MSHCMCLFARLINAVQIQGDISVQVDLLIDHIVVSKLLITWQIMKCSCYTLMQTCDQLTKQQIFLHAFSLKPLETVPAKPGFQRIDPLELVFYKPSRSLDLAEVLCERSLWMTIAVDRSDPQNLGLFGRWAKIQQKFDDNRLKLNHLSLLRLQQFCIVRHIAVHNHCRALWIRLAVYWTLSW